MKEQSRLATELIQNALLRGASKAQAVLAVKSALGALDKPAYSANEEQLLLDRVRDACVLAKLDALASQVHRENDAPRLGGQTASVNPPASLVRGKTGGQVASANTPSASPGKGVTPVAQSPIVPGVFAADTVRALELLTKEAQRKKTPAVRPPKTSDLASSIQLGGHDVTKSGGGRRLEIILTSAGARRI